MSLLRTRYALRPRHGSRDQSSVEVRAGGRWSDLIDIDAGTIATGDATIEQVGTQLFQLILDVASGRKQTWLTTGVCTMIWRSLSCACHLKIREIYSGERRYPIGETPGLDLNRRKLPTHPATTEAVSVPIFARSSSAPSEAPVLRQRETW